MRTRVKIHASPSLVSSIPWIECKSFLSSITFCPLSSCAATQRRIRECSMSPLPDLTHEIDHINATLGDLEKRQRDSLRAKLCDHCCPVKCRIESIVYRDRV